VGSEGWGERRGGGGKRVRKQGENMLRAFLPPSFNSRGEEGGEGGIQKRKRGRRERDQHPNPSALLSIH